MVGGGNLLGEGNEDDGVADFHLHPGFALFHAFPAKNHFVVRRLQGDASGDVAQLIAGGTHRLPIERELQPARPDGDGIEHADETNRPAFGILAL